MPSRNQGPRSCGRARSACRSMADPGSKIQVVAFAVTSRRPLGAWTPIDVLRLRGPCPMPIRSRLPEQAQAMHDVLGSIDALGEAAAGLFAEIGEATKDHVGITRDAYGEKETAAAEI